MGINQNFFDAEPAKQFGQHLVKCGMAFMTYRCFWKSWWWPKHGWSKCWRTTYLLADVPDIETVHAACLERRWWVKVHTNFGNIASSCWARIDYPTLRRWQWSEYGRNHRTTRTVRSAQRNCLNRYMEICDELNANTESWWIFLIKTVFGKVLAIKIFWSLWFLAVDLWHVQTQKESHFVMNAHFVNSEQIIKMMQMLHGWCCKLQLFT